MNNFQEAYQLYHRQVEDALAPALNSGSFKLDDPVCKAAHYSLMAGGKRIRPVLFLTVAESLGADMSTSLQLACAIEMIHTYSLIHDDLPCMDDDDLRRGRPTCHIVFGEATAILAGDALLNRAYELILDAISFALPGSLAAGRMIAQAAGLKGMIAGQSLDLAAEGIEISLDDLMRLHRYKTGALIKAPIIAAAYLAVANADRLKHLEAYADAIGLAFQIQDDILDVVADSHQLGKSTGKDERDQKSTYVRLLGLEGARSRLAEMDTLARTQLDQLAKTGMDTRFLSGMTDFLLQRSY